MPRLAPIPSLRPALLLLAGMAVLAAGTLGTLGTTNLLGRPSFGALVLRSDAQRCLAVNPVTPVSWPALASGALQVGDCIETVGGIPIGDRKLIDTRLRALVDGPPSERFVEVAFRRAEMPFVVTLPVARIGLFEWLQVQVGLVVVALACWLMALVVLLAQPHAEANQVYALLYLATALGVVGLHHQFQNDQVGRLYTALTIVISPQLIGAALFHLALLIPEPLRRRRWLRFALYPPALVGLGLHLDSMLDMAGEHPWSPDFARAANLIGAALMFAGLVVFVGRMLLAARPGPQLRVMQQARLLLVSWALGVTPLLAIAVFFLATNRLPRAVSLQTGLFFLPIALTGTAFAMLRYQAFAYRGRLLQGMTALFVSASAACLALPLLLPYHIDGPLFVAVLVCALVTTLFWYQDTPLRRAFRRYFLRHQQDYRIAYMFSRAIRETQPLDELLATAARMIGESFEAEWVAVRLGGGPERQWVAGQGVHPAGMSALLATTSAAGASLIAGPAGAIGVVCIGPRTTGEPLDEEDYGLLSMLTDHLGRVLTVQSQLDRLARVPGVVLAAQEQERSRLSQELHDAVLPYLSALPFGLERVRRLLGGGGEARAELWQLLDRYSEKATATARELRNIIGQLQMPDLHGARLFAALRTSCEAICGQAQVALVWDVAEAAPELEAEAALHLYRLVQQAVTNAVQHSRSDAVHVQARSLDGAVEITIRDDGVGFDPAQESRPGHIGLLSMRERAHALGATLRIDSAPGAGTRVSLTLPAQRPPRYVPLPGLALGDASAGLAHTPLEAEYLAVIETTRRATAEAGRRDPLPFVLVGGALVVALTGAGYAMSRPSTICVGAAPARCVVAARASWQRTGITVVARQRLSLRVIEGQWTINAEGLEPFTGPGGQLGNRPEWTVLPTADLGALIGRIDDGPPFAIGAGPTFVVPASGELQLRQNDDTCDTCFLDNDGQLVIEISAAP